MTEQHKGWHLILIVVIFHIYCPCIHANTASKRLYNYLLHERGYNRHVRPVENEEDQLNVEISIKLAQIIDVDEKNQVMTTNLWVLLRWKDMTLTWEPKKYNNATKLWVPANYVWHPDIVLFNNADGKYEMTTDTKVTIDSDGTVTWEPPANFKSGCNIDVTYFPFDEQTCTLEFGSWTYSIAEVEINHTGQVGEETVVEPGIDLSVFYRGVEWDLVAVPASKSYIHYAGSVEKFCLWTFALVLKRRFLYYTINLIVPLISHAFITILVFYLPADSKQKITLCINVFFSLIVFFLMLAEIIPPSSIVVPLLGKYLVFTMILVVISVIVTVITYNVHYRSAATCTMGSWTKKVFLYWLPRLLKMRRPKIENSHDVELKQIKLRFCSCCQPEEQEEQMAWLKRKLAKRAAEKQNLRTYQFGSKRTMTQTELMTLSRELDESTGVGYVPGNDAAIQDAIDGALYIANHLRQEDEFKRTQEDWKYVALVMDRCLLWIYVLICLFGSIGIVCQAPMLYDSRTAKEINKTQTTDVSHTGFVEFCTKKPDNFPTP